MVLFKTTKMLPDEREKSVGYFSIIRRLKPIGITSVNKLLQNKQQENMQLALHQLYKFPFFDS